MKRRAIAAAIVVRWERKDCEKEQKEEARSFLESADPASTAPPSLSLRIRRSVARSLVARSVGGRKRGPYDRGERRGRGTRKRDRQVGPREEAAAAMVTVAFPPRLVAMETPREPLSFTFGCPLSVSFALPESTVPFSSNPMPGYLLVLAHPANVSYTLSQSFPLSGCSPRSRQHAKLLSTSGIRSYSLRSFAENEEDERTREIKRNERAIRRREKRGKRRCWRCSRMRDTAVFHDEPGRLSFRIVRLVID